MKTASMALMMVALGVTFGCKRDAGDRPMSNETASEAAREAEELTPASRTEAERKAAEQVAPVEEPAAPGDRGMLDEPRTQPTRSERQADADFKAAKGYNVDGEAKLVEGVSGVQLSIEVEDAPQGAKAIYLYEGGDCSDPASKTKLGTPYKLAGSPTGTRAGEIGTLNVDQDGKGKLEITLAEANLREKDAKSLVGKVIVIQAADKAGTASAKMAPLACAVITED